MTWQDRALFLVWGPPSYGPRSRVLGRKLGIPVEFIYSTRRRGLLVAPWKYSYQLVMTVAVLIKQRPKVIFVQSPPSFAPAVLAAYAALSRVSLVIDLHSDAMVGPLWTRPRWFHRLIRNRATLNIVTNDVHREEIEREGGTALVVRDPPASFEAGKPPDLDERRHVMVVTSFADDEPLDAIRGAAELCPGVQFHVTGHVERAPQTLTQDLPSNLELTGFLADPDYYALMSASDAVMCLTTRDNTLQRGACEALAMGRPIITSNWPLLHDYFNKGTVHVGSSAEDIADGVRRAIDSGESLAEGIVELAQQHEREWVEASKRLSTLLSGIER